jgi:hypothetical protein
MSRPQIRGIKEIKPVEYEFGGVKNPTPIFVGLDDEGNICLIIEESMVMTATDGYVVGCFVKN